MRLTARLTLLALACRLAFSPPAGSAPASSPPLLAAVTELLYTQRSPEARKLAEAAPPSADAHIAEGLVLYELAWCKGSKDLGPARKEFEAAGKGPLSEGLLAYVDSNYSTALEDFQAAEKSQPAPYVDLWMGRALLALYRGDEATAPLQRAQSAWHDKSATVLLLQGEVAASGNHEAYPLLERATQMAPELIPGWLTLGRLRQEAGETDAAIGSYQRALSNGAAPNPLVLQLAVLQRLLGHVDDARRSLSGVQVGGDAAFGSQIALEVALDTLLQDQTPDYASLEHLSGLPESQLPKLKVLQGWAALSRNDFISARDLLRAGTTYSDSDAADVNVLMYVGMASVKLAAVDPDRLGRERLQAITLYAKAWENVVKGSPMQKRIESAFGAAKQSEIAAINRAIENNLAMMSQIGNRNSAERLKQELEERLGQAQQLQLGTPGTLRGDLREAHESAQR